MASRRPNSCGRDRRNIHIPVIFLSAVYRGEEHLIKGALTGAVDFLTKPLVPEILQGKVRIFLDLYRNRIAMQQEIERRMASEKAQKRLRQALKAANADLSKKIGQRTVALTNANQALQVEVAERKRAEKDLQKTIGELKQFAYIVSHDLQEPLRMVSSFVQLLARRYEGKLDKNADEYIHFAVDGTNRMREMIASILNYSRVNSVQKEFEDVDCNASLDQVISDLGVSIDASRTEVTRDPLPKVWGSKTQLGQVFQNLIGNAIKFRSDAPVRIHIFAPSAESLGKKSTASDTAKNKFRIFGVHDNGIGIEAQYAERIFQIFQRLHAREKYPGTGIGLAICRKIVERHGGRIWMESEPGKGTTFYFTLWETK